MTVYNFTEEENSDTQYDYKILIYGNYTFRKNLEADSLVEVLRHVIPFMSKRWKIHFTILLPSYVKSLEFDNVEQRIYKLPSFINQMRTHFDSEVFMKHINWKHEDWDIIYTHMPEHTLQMANCLHNNSNVVPKFIGYSHWFEVVENANYGTSRSTKNPARMLYASVAGLLQMDECGVNSDWLKQTMMNEAKNHWNDDVISDLDKIVQPHYLGVDRINPRKEYKDKTVVFNHRGATYTGWPWFVKYMDELWEERQDFKVYTTLTQIDKPWCINVNCESRDEYMEFLSTMKFGVGCFEQYSAWSISTTDGFSVGVPYLLPDNFCYPEMVDENYPYLYSDKNEFKEKFNYMLDNPITHDVSKIAESMIWEERISKWFNNWEDVFNLDSIGETESLLKIKDFIERKGFVTKNDILKELGWGVRIKFSRYRNALRKFDEIKFTKNGYEWIG